MRVISDATFHIEPSFNDPAHQMPMWAALEAIPQWFLQQIKYVKMHINYVWHLKAQTLVPLSSLSLIELETWEDHINPRIVTPEMLVQEALNPCGIKNFGFDIASKIPSRIEVVVLGWAQVAGDVSKDFVSLAWSSAGQTVSLTCS